MKSGQDVEGFAWVNGTLEMLKAEYSPNCLLGTCLHPLAAFNFAYEMGELSIEREAMRFIFLICTHCREVKPKSGVLNLSQVVELFLFSKGSLSWIWHL